MIILDAPKFITFLHSLFEAEQMSRGISGDLTDNMGARLSAVAEDMKTQCEALELPVSARTAVGMIGGVTTVERAHEAVRTLINNIAMELDGRKF